MRVGAKCLALRARVRAKVKAHYLGVGLEVKAMVKR